MVLKNYIYLKPWERPIFLENYKFEKIMGYECEILKKWNGKYKKN